jgi:hypothetical protein
MAVRWMKWKAAGCTPEGLTPCRLNRSSFCFDQRRVEATSNQAGARDAPLLTGQSQSRAASCAGTDRVFDLHQGRVVGEGVK